MLRADNIARVIEACGDGLVLDVGGWADPFPRADYVIDYFTYETRRLAYHGIHRLPVTVRYPDPLPGERFTRERWVVHDICGPNPFPFPDRMFDFVICSHTLEDIRDPIRVCAEMMRVGKAGYIETPSRLAEQTMGVESAPGMVGYAHHRWLVEYGKQSIVFRPKPYHLHTDPALHVPRSFLRRRGESALTDFLFWKDAFRAEEIWAFDARDEAARFVASLGIPPADYRAERREQRRRRRQLRFQPAAQRYRQFRMWLGRVRRGRFRAPTAESPPAELWTWATLFKAARPSSAAEPGTDE
mgnify:CR=1 FL=1